MYRKMYKKKKQNKKQEILAIQSNSHFSNFLCTCLVVQSHNQQITPILHILTPLFWFQFFFRVCVCRY